MAPAFSSTRQAGAFVLLTLFLLLAPVLMGRRALPPREAVYSSLDWNSGSFPYLEQEIFHEKGDIDIAFMGSSKIWWAIDTPVLQAELSHALGRPATVRSLCWNWAGCDVWYFVLRDLLEHRNVKCVVFPDLITSAANAAHTRASFFYREGEDAGELNGLPLPSKVSFYGSAVLGAPRQWLGLARTDLPAVNPDLLSWQGAVLFSNIVNPRLRLGTLTVNMGTTNPFVKYTPTTMPAPDDTLVYTEATKSNFHFDNMPAPETQAVFARKIAELAREKHVALVYLRLPRLDARGETIEEPCYWPDLFGGSLTMMGIPGARLFHGMTDEEILKLFFNDEHLNENGQKYFTAAVAPALIHVYENQVQH